jgi:dipeptidyl aminopeptidase/acylaminoacyl peptidase
VIRPYARGYDESEGVRDLGGKKDLADSQKLLEIFDSASFIENSKIFVAGSSEGSVNALRLFAEDAEKRISGCAVVDVIADLPAFGDFRGAGVQNLFASLIGKTYEEAPEEYDLRSAVKFSDKLDRPILLLHFLQSPLFSVEQTDALYDLIKDTNKDCTYHKIDALSGDFQGESLQRLLSWMNKYD